MSIFGKPEVIILKETSDSKTYLSQLEELQKEITPGTELAKKLDKEIAITKAGIIGEDAILFELKNSGMDLVVLHDIYIETNDGRGAQIDYVVITPYARVFIECKNLFGDIEINSKGDFIRTIFYGGRKIREGIYSPITQNQRHMAVFKDIQLSEHGIVGKASINLYFNEYNRSLVVLANPKTVVNDRYAPKDVKEQVIRCDQLIAKLKSIKGSDKSSKKDMLDSGERMLAKNIDSQKEYIQKFLELKKLAVKETREKTSTVSEQLQGIVSEREPLVCPWCGKDLVLRTAKKGTNVGKQFYGCSGFPKCRYVKNV